MTDRTEAMDNLIAQDADLIDAQPTGAKQMIEILIKTGYFNHNTATDFLHKLEQFGHTVYKKKVFANGRRPNSSQPITPDVVQAMRVYYAANPEATQQKIANQFNVNIGRVNEALR